MVKKASQGRILIFVICTTILVCALSSCTAKKTSPNSIEVTATNQATAADKSLPIESSATPATSTKMEKAWNMVWNDEFDGENGSPVDKSKWVSEIGNNSGWGNAEYEYYTDSVKNCYQENGNLIIKAIKEKKDNFDYTSARIKTKGIFEFTYGKIEMKAKLPQGDGIWPAFWMLGANIDTKQWPDCGEIDIMEHIGKSPNNIYGTLHGPGYSGATGLSSLTVSKTSLYDSFHTYTVEWDQEGFKWFFDGVQYYKIVKANMTGRTWPFDEDFFILLNLAVGGNWPGNPSDLTKFPQSYTIDYVRVYQSK